VIDNREIFEGFVMMAGCSGNEFLLVVFVVMIVGLFVLDSVRRTR
jgi:hypothetical protein